MDVGLIANWVIAAVTAAGVIIAVVTYRRQTKVTVFLEYTKRYREVMAAESLGKWRLQVNEPYDVPADAEELERLRLALLGYLNLCAEEFSLWKKRWLSKGTWSTWEVEMKRILRTPWFRQDWLFLRKEFDSYEEFQKYVRDIQG
jgi:hypothetical protein